MLPKMPFTNFQGIEMNSSLFYALFFTGFGIFDIFAGNGTAGFDFGISLIFLGLGLGKKNVGETKDLG